MSHNILEILILITNYQLNMVLFEVITYLQSNPMIKFLKAFNRFLKQFNLWPYPCLMILLFLKLKELHLNQLH